MAPGDQEAGIVPDEAGCKQGTRRFLVVGWLTKVYITVKVVFGEYMSASGGYNYCWVQKS